MTWAKLDDGFFRHPKARAAGKDGRALFLAGLCWAASHLTDGFIATHDLGLIAAEAEVRAKAVAARLVDVGLWAPVSGGWQIHDYLDFNPTAEAAKEKRRQRAKAGRKGGLKSKPPHTKPEAEPEAIASANGKQNGTPSPYPYPTEELTSSDVFTIEPDPPDDDHQEQQPDPQVETTLAVLAARDLDARQQAKGNVGDPVSWTNAVIDRRRAADGAHIADLASQHADASATDLADLLEPPAPALALVPAGHRPDPLAGQQAAARARAELNRRRMAGDVCPACKGTDWVQLGNGDVHECTDCQDPR